MLVLQWVQLFSEVDLYLPVVWLAGFGSPLFPHLHRVIGGQTLHPEAHLLGKLRCCRIRNAMVRIQVWHTIVKLKENGGQVPNSETESERTGEANDEVHNCLIYWAIQGGLLTPLTFARHRLSPLAAFTCGYFLHNGRR